MTARYVSNRVLASFRLGQSIRLTCIPHLHPVFAKDVLHTFIDIPVRRITRKNEALPRLLQVGQDAFQMRRGMEVSPWVIRHYSVEVTRDMSVTNSSQDVLHGVGWAVVDVSVFEELDSGSV